MIPDAKESLSTLGSKSAASRVGGWGLSAVGLGGGAFAVTQQLAEAVALEARLNRLMTNARGDRQWRGAVYETSLARAIEHGVRL